MLTYFFADSGIGLVHVNIVMRKTAPLSPLMLGEFIFPLLLEPKCKYNILLENRKEQVMNL